MRNPRREACRSNTPAHKAVPGVTFADVMVGLGLARSPFNAPNFGRNPDGNGYRATYMVLGGWHSTSTFRKPKADHWLCWNPSPPRPCRYCRRVMPQRELSMQRDWRRYRGYACSDTRACRRARRRS